MGKNSKKNRGGNAGTGTAAAAAADTIADTIAAAAGADTIAGSSGVEITSTTTETVNMENNTTTTTAVTVKKRVPMARVLIGGAIALLTADVQSVKAYVKGFMSLGVGARKGYDNYWAKEDGFTNPESIMKLTPQGIGKMAAILHHRAALYISEGGEKATEMLSVLEGIRAYESIAVAEATEVAKNRLFNEALATMTKAMGGDEAAARKALANFAMTAPSPVPAASVTPTTPTIGESGGNVADADDTADDDANAESRETVEA